MLTSSNYVVWKVYHIRGRIPTRKQEWTRKTNRKGAYDPGPRRLTGQVRRDRSGGRAVHAFVNTTIGLYDARFSFQRADGYYGHHVHSGQRVRGREHGAIR